MKAHTTEKQEIILSIGMIVKNEEKVLERCLKSLQPLMNAIPSELIIADTGSTDSTVEIAKKYTDNVFRFEWINDFAAARNSTLEKAKGKWYFFLDADEYLDEDIHELTGFFRIPELYMKYKCAQITLHNYYDPQKKQYGISMLPRFHRIVRNVDETDAEVKFMGAIHETIYMRQPMGYFQTILHHTGYAFNSGTQFENKKERNLALMREEYRNTEPQYRSRIISLLIDGAGSYPEEMERYIKEALSLIKKNINDNYARGLFVQAIGYYRYRAPVYALEICDKYFELFSNAYNYVATVGVTLYKADILSRLGRFDKSYDEYKKYQELYSDYKNDKLNLNDCAYRNIPGLMEYEYFGHMISAINCLVEIRKYDEAMKSLTSIALSEIRDEDFALFLSTLKNICIKQKDYSKLAEYYDLIMKTNDDNKISLALNMMESTFYTWSLTKERVNFAKQIKESGINGTYPELMRLYLSQDEVGYTDKLFAFINNIDSWKEGYAEAIYLAIRNKLDISHAVDKIESSSYGDMLGLIAGTHDDFAECVLEYGVPTSFTETITRFCWIVTMYECVTYRCFELNEEKKYKLYFMFTSLLGEYVSNIYNPELFNDEEDMMVLPSLHRFGYYMLKANTHLNEGNSVKYIGEMKKALINCESMKEIVEFMLEQFKNKIGM